MKANRPSLKVFERRREPAVDVEVCEKVLARRAPRRKGSSVFVSAGVDVDAKGWMEERYFDAPGAVSQVLMADEMMP